MLVLCDTQQTRDTRASKLLCVVRWCCVTRSASHDDVHAMRTTPAHNIQQFARSRAPRLCVTQHQRTTYNNLLALVSRACCVSHSTSTQHTTFFSFPCLLYHQCTTDNNLFALVPLACVSSTTYNNLLTLVPLTHLHVEIQEIKNAPGFRSKSRAKNEIFLFPGFKSRVLATLRLQIPWIS